MKIKTKIILYLGIFIFALIGGIFLLNYSVVRHSLKTSAHSELLSKISVIHHAAEALLETTIKNYLRGITRSNYDFIVEQYRAVQTGSIDMEQAKNIIQHHFDQQTVGKSGYLIAVLSENNRLYLDLHPYLKQQECSASEGCQQWLATKNGYTEYMWQNPNDRTSRKKVAYLKEFTPWNWIIGASSYRDEFTNLINLKDLESIIVNARIQQSGHFFISDHSGKAILHPHFAQKQELALFNQQFEPVFTLLQQSDSGYITYDWVDPTTGKTIRKYGLISRIVPFDLYLIGTGDIADIYAPVSTLKTITFLMVSAAAIILFFLIFKLSDNLSKPLNFLQNGIESFYLEGTPFHWKQQSAEEVNALGEAFERMSSELEKTLFDLQQKNQQLESSEKQQLENRILLENIINSMPSIIVGIDETLNITLWNSRARDYAENGQIVTGSQLATTFPHLEAHLTTIRSAMATDSVVDHFYSHLDQGEKRYFEMTIYPLIVKNNGAVIRIDNVTKRVEMEQHLRQSQKMDALGQLAGGIAHDFNNMLSGIVGATELLQIKVQEQDQKLVQIIALAAERAGQLVQKLLAFSRKDTISVHSVDMHDLIAETTEILTRTLDKKIELRLLLKADSSIVKGDVAQLQNTLLNLGINSGQAMTNGGVLSFSTTNITLTQWECDEYAFALSPGLFLQIVVSDTGCGIEEEHLKQIFEPFFTTKEQGKGTGLGLSAVYGAMQQHHGAVTVTSILGQGCSFTLLLPVFKGATATLMLDDSLVTGKGTVLVIDDELIIRETARLMLQRLGYSVLEAADGREGLELYTEYYKAIDLVLLDMIMPVMNGEECFYKLKQINPDIPVLISSGYTRDTDLSALKEKGLNGFIRKPYNLAQLSKALRQALTK